MRLSVVLALASTITLIALVGDAAPVTSPVTLLPQPRPGLAPSRGTLTGIIQIGTPVQDPIFTATCADMTVIARDTSGSGNPVSVKATGDVAARKCFYTMTLNVGRWSLDAQLAGKSIISAPVPLGVVTKDETSTAHFGVNNFPTAPIAVVRATVDISGTAVQCSQLKMTVAHALKTQASGLVSKPVNTCYASLSNVPVGAVTVSIVGLSTPLAPQQASASTTQITDLNFTLPKFATVRVNLHPADYPAQHNPPLVCTPYSLNVKKDGVTVATAKPNASASTVFDCSMQTTSLTVPANVPVVLELLKNGAVVKTETVGPLAPSQFLDRVYQPLP